MNRSMPPYLEVSGMSKRFGSLAALSDVSLEIRPGSFHALLGENGAGKSTLVKCIMGYYHPDEGSIKLDGVERKISSPKEAHAAGIGMVYQHFTLVPNMTVAENLVLARPILPRFIDWRSEIENLRNFLKHMPFQVDLLSLVSTLAAGEKQKVEIIKQLYLNSRLLFLDEPTSVLTPGEADQILGLLREMCQAGKISVLMISHKFREVMAFADEVTVLRRGRISGRGKVQDLTPAEMARMMIGDSVVPALAERAASRDELVKLRIEDLHAENEKGLPAICGVSLALCGGEIVGIAGVSGNGQRELVEVLSGQRDKTSGQVLLHGETYSATRGEMRRHKFSCLPEEPLRNGAVPRMSVADNLAFRTFDRPPFAVFRWFLNRKAIRMAAEKLISEYRVKTPSPDASIDTLSGGNIQRVVLARELSDEVEVSIVANPCFGLDFSATSEIRSRIVQARNRGAAVLLISEDLDEIFELSDRILVMSGGKFTYECDNIDVDIGEIGRHMAGH